MENLDLELSVLAADGETLMSALKDGLMVIARSQDNFMYVYEDGGSYRLFTHTPGEEQGGQKQFPKDEKYSAIVKNIASVADSMFSVKFDKSLSIYPVMFTAEQAVLNTFPLKTLTQEHEQVEFFIHGQENPADE